MQTSSRKSKSRRSVPTKFEFLDDVFHRAQPLSKDLLPNRWEKMAEGPFNFFRGTTATFYRHWLLEHPKPRSPFIWVCGDAHWENIGSYRGKNRVAYFDLTDFDHACLAPVELELGRALTAYSVVGASRLARSFLTSYRETLRGGKPQHIEQEIATGAVAKLLKEVTRRRRKKFLREWVEKGRIRILPGETYALGRGERAQATRIFRAWAVQRKERRFFELLDICGSLSGVGAIGTRRYLLLVKGGNRPHLIDMKEGSISGLAELRLAAQPQWSCEAERIATVQAYIQYVPIAHLGWTRSRDLSFTLSDFQPTEDRVESEELPEDEYVSFGQKWGRLLAWAHLRGASWKGGATVDALMEYGDRLGGAEQKRMLHAAHLASEAYRSAYVEFVKLVADGGGPALKQKAR